MVEEALRLVLRAGAENVSQALGSGFSESGMQSWRAVAAVGPGEAPVQPILPKGETEAQ